MSGQQDESDGFLSRWSRRKAAARAPEPEALPGPGLEAPGPSLLEAVPDDEVDEAYVAALPPIDMITAATDLAPFMRKGVPALLRNAALRRMWSADPLIRDYLDVARDYYWDWNAPGGVPGGGGTISAEAVEKMARNITGAPEPKNPDDVVADAQAGTGDPETIGEEPSEATDSAEEDPAPVARTEATPAPASVTAGPVPQGPATEPRRKHGGAIPG